MISLVKKGYVITQEQVNMAVLDGHLMLSFVRIEGIKVSNLWAVLQLMLLRRHETRCKYSNDFRSNSRRSILREDS